MSEAVQALNSKLAVASGITCDNIDAYLPYIDVYLVATGISIDHYELDEVKVSELALKIAQFNARAVTSSSDLKAK